MAVRTAEQYLKSLKDGRLVYCLGERVKDVGITFSQWPYEKRGKGFFQRCLSPYRSVWRFIASGQAYIKMHPLMIP